MTTLALVQEFAARTNRLSRMTDLGTALEAVVRDLGFDYFAMAHHVDLNTPPGDAVRLDNYPAAWVEVILTRKYFVDDPILVASQRAAAGFLWSDVPSLLDLTARQKHILQQAGREGLGGGFTVPVHVPGEFSGSCSFGVRTGRTMPDDALPTAQYVGAFAFEAARRIRRRERSRSGQAAETRVRLSSRQRDCVILVAQGLTHAEVAVELGIGVATVLQHLENARRKYAVESRSTLLVRALYEGDVTFSDILKGPPASP